MTQPSKPMHRAAAPVDAVLQLLLGNPRGELPEVRTALLLTLREHVHVTVLACVWVLTGALAAWYLVGAAWGLAAAAAEILLFTLRLAASRDVARTQHEPRHRAAYGAIFLGLGAWMGLIAACTYGLASQPDLRLVLIGTILSCGFSGYAVSRWAAFPRFTAAVIAILWGALGLGLAASPLDGAGAIAWLTPAGAVAFYVLLRLNHVVIGDAMRAQHENKRLSMHDALTDLPNRLMMRERLTVRCRDLAEHRGGVFAVLCLDLDGFKAVNDRHGHGGGDWLLKLVAERMCHAVRSDDLVSRTGGDEFVMLLPGANEAAATDAARRIVAAIAQPYDLGGTAMTVRVGVSIGIALAPQHGTQPDVLLTGADDAMYAAKRAGKSRWCLHGGPDAVAAATEVAQQDVMV